MVSTKNTVALFIFAFVVEYTTALYFHIGETERKCFIEEIPDETTVLGKFEVARRTNVPFLHA